MLKRYLFSLTMSTALVFLFFLPALASDILWSRTYGGSSIDYAESAQRTADGGFVVAGITHSFGAGDRDVLLIKTNSTGDTLWTRAYGGIASDFANSVQQTADGGYVVAGFTRSFGAGQGDMYLIRTDSTGVIIWSRTCGGGSFDQGYSVQQTSDGGYLVVGETYSFGAGNNDFYLVKTDSVGDTLWTRTYGGSAHDVGFRVQQTPDGGYIVAGWTESFGAGGWDVYLIKTNSTGDTLWTRTYGGPGTDMGSSVRQTADGGYVVVGMTASFGAGDEDLLLIRTDSVGGIMWTRTYGGSIGDGGSSVQQTTDGGYIVAGRTESFGGPRDIFLIKTDSAGDPLWTRTVGGDSSEYSCSVRQTPNGGYLVAGHTKSFGAGTADFLLAMLDSLGNACIGEFVSSTVTSVSCSVTSPPTVVSSPLTIVTSPPTIEVSPSTEVTIVCERVCGDVNDDSLVGLGDVVHLINYLYKGGDPPDPPGAGDVTCDEATNIGDVVYLINYLFRHGPPPCC